jgi:hypothetical protein
MPNNNTEIVLDDKDDGSLSSRIDHQTSKRFKYEYRKRNLTY